MEYNVKKGDFSNIGATKGKTWTEFCLVCRKEADCKILLYKRDGKDKPEEIAVPAEFSKGNLRAVRIDKLDLSEYDYNFCIDGEIVCDPYAKRITGREIWADLNRKESALTDLRCRLGAEPFSWRGDCEVEIPRKDMVLYKLHVRGFTKGMPEGTPDRGTFRGLEKKLPYLKSLGITSIELMPVYEFEELMPVNPAGRPEEFRSRKKTKAVMRGMQKTQYKLNYWGYGKGMYFAPKASYAAGDDPETELKSCILGMHKRGMECILEMDFPDTVSGEMIRLVLRYWGKEYHVDGFHLQGNGIPMGLLLEDPFLGRTKLFYREIYEHEIPIEEALYPRAFVDKDEFLYPCRKLAGGLDGNIWELADQMKKQDIRLGYINYIADNNGYTLADLFTYERKHNEANGEHNTDGPEWSFSINCGTEGESNSRNIQKIRCRRMRNAVAMLFLSQGTPMLMAGDEDCNTQKGNNNTYCQDNPVGWKDWSRSRAAKEFTKYVKQMIAFRKAHAILRMEQPMKLADAKGHGYPDLSYHEESAWISPRYRNRKAIGIMYCGKYAGEEEDIYIGFNFSDFPKKLALPCQKGKRAWYLAMDTTARYAFLPEQEELKETWYLLDAQSVCIIIGKQKAGKI